MNKWQHKIVSFTLTELLVVMAISTIVVSLAFSVIGLLQRNVRQIQTNYKTKTEIQLLQQQLALDLQNFPEARVSYTQGQLTFGSPIDSTVYQFEKEYILRKQDTFDLTFKEKLYYFSGDVVSTGTIDAIKLRFSEKDSSKTIFLYKRNDALIKTNYGY